MELLWFWLELGSYSCRQSNLVNGNYEFYHILSMIQEAVLVVDTIISFVVLKSISKEQLFINPYATVFIEVMLEWYEVDRLSMLCYL